MKNIFNQYANKCTNQFTFNPMADLPRLTILLILGLLLTACGGGGSSGGGGGSSPSGGGTANANLGQATSQLNAFGITDLVVIPSPSNFSLSWINPVSPAQEINTYSITALAYADETTTDIIAGASGNLTNTRRYTSNDAIQTYNFGNLTAGRYYEFFITATYMDSTTSAEIRLFSGRLLAGLNTDGTGLADGQDTDDDGDGISDTRDNCPLIANTDQENTDGAADGGDVCDADDDNDGVIDEQDDFPLDATRTGDSDGDGVGSVRDNCITDANPGQSDLNDDGEGDVCDTDSDFDGDSTNDAFDIDADGDGLIELRTASELNMMRHNLAGTGLTRTADEATNSSGCGGANDADGVRITECSGYELTTHIDLNDLLEGADTSSGPNWQSIGGCANDPCTIFDANFDGGGYNISNLRIHVGSRTTRVGFFGAVAAGNTISNVHLRNVNITVAASATADAIGGLVGYGNNIIITSASATVLELVGSDDVGGLIGNGDGSRITSAYVIANNIKVSALSIGSNAGMGGIAGSLLARGTITSSYALIGTLEGGQDTGSLVGRGDSSEFNSSYAILDNSLGEIVNTGGLIGSSREVILGYSYAVTNNILSPIAGGLFGGVGSSTLPSRIADSYWDNTTLSFIETNVQFQEDIDQGRPTSELQVDLNADGSFPEIYSSWAHAYCNPTTGAYQETTDARSLTDGFIRAWDLGTASEYPASNCTPTFTPAQQREVMTRILAGEAPLPLVAPTP